MYKTPDIKDLFATPANFIALGCGSGLLKPAPGTWGTVFAVLPYLWISQLAWPVYFLIIISGFLLGVWACQRCADYLGVHDHGAIVWDEVIGFWLTMIIIPLNWLTVLLGFALFRLFDIVKPWPISWLDKTTPGGFGIMLDDILAGIYAGICLQLIYVYLLPIIIGNTGLMTLK